jgi:SAM-dependent methyltransferase
MTGGPEAREHFARLAPSYAAIRGRGPLGILRRRERAAVQSLVDARRGELVLDAGCGDGDTMEWLAARGARVVGIDFAFPMAAACRRRGFAVSVQDLERPGLQSRFDWVLCIGALEFTSEPGAAVRNLAACLRPGGRLALLFPRTGAPGLLYRLYHRSHGVGIRLFSVEEILGFLADAGLGGRARLRHCWLSSVAVASAGSHHFPDRRAA